MTIPQESQDENCGYRKIAEELIVELKKTYKLKQYEIAERVGVSPETISRAGEEGGRQLAKGLELLRDLLRTTSLIEDQERLSRLLSEALHNNPKFQPSPQDGLQIGDKAQPKNGTAQHSNSRRASPKDSAK